MQSVRSRRQHRSNWLEPMETDQIRGYFVPDAHPEHTLAPGTKCERVIHRAQCSVSHAPMNRSACLRVHSPVGIVQPDQAAKAQVLSNIDEFERGQLVGTDDVQ